MLCGAWELSTEWVAHFKKISVWLEYVRISLM